MTILRSSNPVLTHGERFDPSPLEAVATSRPEVMTVQGVVNKTAILVAIAIVAGAFGYWLIATVGTSMSLVTMSALVSMGVCFGVGMVLYRKPKLAVILAPIYAVTQGVFLGVFSGALDTVLVSLNAKIAGGVAVQAFVITIAIMLAMLGLYSARIIRPTKPLVAIVSVATVGIMFTYLISWPLGLIFGIDLPFIGLSSAIQGGTAGWIGLGVNVLILGIASLWLILDFGMIEAHVENGAPKHMEWYGGFALLVTLAWIYYEAVKIAFRVALIFANRD